MATIKGFKGGLFTGAKPTPLTPSEALVSKSIQDYLNARQVYNDRLNAGSFERVSTYTDKNGQQKEYRRWYKGAKKGSPDRFAIVKGLFIAIEVKKLGKKPTPEQIERHDELRRAGAVIIVSDSIDDFIFQFTELILSPPFRGGIRGDRRGKGVRGGIPDHPSRKQDHG